MNDTRKQAIINALRAFAEQRPGLDPRNYGSRRDYCSESRRITQDLADARTLLAYVSGQDAITADMILNADPGGRLTIDLRFDWRIAETAQGGSKVTGWTTGFASRDAAAARVALWRAKGNTQLADSARIHEPRNDARVSYCTGQYWPVEYRRAVCRLLSLVLWSYVREHDMPEHNYAQGGGIADSDRKYPDFQTGRYTLSAGDWLRAHFKREFGRRIASRYFG